MIVDLPTRPAAGDDAALALPEEDFDPEPA